MAFSMYNASVHATSTDHLKLSQSTHHSEYNLGLRQTVGLCALHKTIREGGAPPTDSAILNGRYKPISVLGKGTFSQLVVAEDLYHPSKRQVAIKIMNKSCEYIGIQECQKIALFNSMEEGKGSNVVKLYGHFYYGKHFCLVLELLGVSLLQHMSSFPKNRLPLAQVRKVAVQLLTSLAFVKQCGIIHADLKPENVLLTERTPRTGLSKTTGGRAKSIGVKLVDFGNAMSNDDIVAYYDEFEVQSLYYRAPEVLLGYWDFGSPIDMWSLGCLLAELVLGQPLFRARSPSELYNAHMKVLGKIPSGVFNGSKFYSLFVNPSTDEMSYEGDSTLKMNEKTLALMKVLDCKDKQFVSFIAGLLEFNPNERLTPRSAFFHPFISDLFPFSLIFGGSVPFDSNQSTVSDEDQFDRYDTDALDLNPTDFDKILGLKRPSMGNRAASPLVKKLVVMENGVYRKLKQPQ